MNTMVSDFHFLRPWSLFAIPIAVLLWVWQLKRMRPGQELDNQIAPHLLKHLVVPPESTSLITPIRLLLPVWCFAILAVAGPTWTRQPSPFGDDLAELMIVLRVSPSMMTEDLPPSRLEQARGKLSAILKARPGAGTGLIAYDGSSHLVMPVTEDGDVIEHMMEALSPDVMPDEGDALADALAMASQQLQKSNAGGSIMIVTDSVSAISRTDLSSEPFDLPTVQFFVPLRTEEALRASGVPAAAKAISASVQTITADDHDVDTLIAKADRAIVSVSEDDATAWQDQGYALVPWIAIASLFWARRGWSVRR